MEERLICPICGVFLSEPYIKCATCIRPQRYFCVKCFAKGKEYESHKNDHPYIIVRNNFSLFDPDWMASEELRLLNAIADHGIGNWYHIAKDVGTKTRNECEEHYFKYYVYSAVPPLPEVPMTKVITEYRPAPISCKAFSQDPPRPVIGSSLYQEMAGYMPGRGDFSTEYDDFAELDIQDLSFDEADDPVWHDLQKSVLNIYQSRLKERARRKWIIKEFGLINMKRNIEDHKRYITLGTEISDKMKKLMRLFTPDDYYQFMEGALFEEKLKNRIKVLQECRRAGLARLSSISVYMRLRRRREERLRTKSILDEVLGQIKDEASCQQYIRRQVLKENSQGIADLIPGAGRKAAPPLNIVGMPGFEKLTSKEREVCASLRLIPSSFFQYKTILINECRKLGSLRLANARSVIKIDVNKTRRIYDLLIEEGLINK